MRGLKTFGAAASVAALLSGVAAPSAYALSDAQVEAVRAAAAKEQPKVVAQRAFARDAQFVFSHLAPQQTGRR